MGQSSPKPQDVVVSCPIASQDVVSGRFHARGGAVHVRAAFVHARRGAVHSAIRGRPQAGAGLCTERAFGCGLLVLQSRLPSRSHPTARRQRTPVIHAPDDCKGRFRVSRWSFMRPVTAIARSPEYQPPRDWMTSGRPRPVRVAAAELGRPARAVVEYPSDDWKTGTTVHGPARPAAEARRPSRGRRP